MSPSTEKTNPGGGPQTRDVVVQNRYGIHARPAALLVKAANKAAPKPEEAPAGPTEIELLTEIRDELKRRP